MQSFSVPPMIPGSTGGSGPVYIVMEHMRDHPKVTLAGFNDDASVYQQPDNSAVVSSNVLKVFRKKKDAILFKEEQEKAYAQAMGKCCFFTVETKQVF